MFLIEVLKLFTSFNLFYILCSKSLFSNGKNTYNFRVSVLFYLDKNPEQIFRDKNHSQYDENISHRVKLMKLL